MIRVNISDIAKGDLHERERRLLHQRDYCGARRCRMVIMNANGFTVKQIAGALSVCKQTVRRTLSSYQEEGIDALTTKPRCGAPRKLTDEVVDEIENIVRQAPRNLLTNDPDYESNTWTLQMLVGYLGKYRQLSFGQTTVYRALKKRDIRIGRPKHTITSPDPDYQAKKDYRDQLMRGVIDVSPSKPSASVIVSPDDRVDVELKLGIPDNLANIWIKLLMPSQSSCFLVKTVIASAQYSFFS